MKISPETVAAFSALALSRSRERVVQALRAALPEQTARIAPADLESFCESRIGRANRFGFATEYEIYVYLAASLAYGFDLDDSRSSERVRQIVQDIDLDPPAKVAALELEVALDTGVRI